MGEMAGGCFCDKIRYRVRGELLNVTLCHCADCRRVTGAPAVAWFSVRPDELSFTRGVPTRFASSPGVTRGFCGDCGTALTYARADLPDEIDLTTASLDAPGDMPPADQTFVGERLDWMETLERLPAHAKARPA